MACQATKWGYEVGESGMVVIMVDFRGEVVSPVVRFLVRYVWGLESWDERWFGLDRSMSESGHGDLDYIIQMTCSEEFEKSNKVVDTSYFDQSKLESVTKLIATKVVLYCTNSC